MVLCQRALPGAPCDAALFCVFDGHNGRGAAEEVKAMMPRHVAQRLGGMRSELESGAGLGDAWREIYTQVDAAIQSEDGCTATTLLAWQDSAGATCFQVHHPLGVFVMITIPCPRWPPLASPGRHRRRLPMEEGAVWA